MALIVRILIMLMLLPFGLKAQKNYEWEGKLMGKAFEIAVVHEDSLKAQSAIQMAIESIRETEQRISSWKDDSETALINKNAGIAPVKISASFVELMHRCKIYHELSEGAFDITIQPLVELWNYPLEQKTMLKKESIQNLLPLINSDSLEIDTVAHTAFLKQEGMQIGFGAVGKGYAAEEAKKDLLSMGIENGLINAGGDITAWGKQANGKPWSIAIQHPRNDKKLMAWLEIEDQAIVTSGDYEAFQIINGKRYSHIINPKTGYPANELYSVSIITYNAELADALATAIFVLGPEKGMALVEKIKNFEAVLFTAENEILTSSGLDIQWERK